MSKRVICPRCGGPARKTETRFGDRHDCCGLWSWGGKPLVDKDTHEARKLAHAMFDRIWKTKKLERGECYRRLSKLMGLSKKECHISLFTPAQCRQVVNYVHSRAILEYEE